VVYTLFDVHVQLTFSFTVLVIVLCHVCEFGVNADGNFENGNIVGLSEQPKTVASMDCTESEILNDVVEIISNEFVGGQVCRLLSVMPVDELIAVAVHWLHMICLPYTQCS